MDRSNRDRGWYPCGVASLVFSATLSIASAWVFCNGRVIEGLCLWVFALASLAAARVAEYGANTFGGIESDDLQPSQDGRSHENC